MKNHLLCTLALVVALVVTVRADDEKKTEPPKPDTYQSLSTEFSKLQQSVATKYRAAKLEDRPGILEEYNGLSSKFTNRFLAFAEGNADDPTAFDALSWIVANDREGKVAAKAIPLIVEKHLDSPKIVRLCQQLSRVDSAAAKSFLQTVIDSSKNVNAQGYATYGLAKAMLGRSGERNEKAEALLARVVKDYAKVANGTLAKSAERDLFEVQHLSIGSEAPNITAEDIDGVEFSLTDYRGKIVVLDFWGDW